MSLLLTLSSSLFSCIIHFKSPTAFKNYAKSTPLVFYKWNNNAWMTAHWPIMWFTDYFKPTVATYCSEKNISFQVLQPIGSVFGCSRAQMEMFSEIVAFIPAVCSVVSNSLQPHWLQPTRLLVNGDSQGKNIGVGYHALLQGIFPTQGSNTGLLYWRWILYCLSYQGSLRILEYNILLQGIIPIQESDWGLLHCRQILY